MGVKIIYLLLLIFAINSCGDNPVESENNGLSQINGPTIIYSMVSEHLTENRINTSYSDENIFNDSDFRLNIRVNPNKTNIAYVKNSTYYPYFGSNINGTPEITISNDFGKTEKKLFSADSSSIFQFDWISSNRLGISSREGNLYFITIINTEGTILYREEVSAQYSMFMLPDEQHLVAYNSTQFGLLDVNQFIFKEYVPECQILSWQQPFFTDSSFVLSYQILSPNEFGYIEFNFDNNSFKKIQSNSKLVYANSESQIFYDYTNSGKLILYRNDSLITSVSTNDYLMNAGLSLINSTDFYFVGAKSINEESLLFKVDFTTKELSKLAKYGKNEFIVDYAFYDF